MKKVTTPAFKALTKDKYDQIIASVKEKTDLLTREKRKSRRNKEFQEMYNDQKTKNVLLNKRVENLSKYESMYRELQAQTLSLERSAAYFRRENATLKTGKVIPEELPNYLNLKAS